MPVAGGGQKLDAEVLDICPHCFQACAKHCHLRGKVKQHGCGGVTNRLRSCTVSQVNMAK